MNDPNQSDDHATTPRTVAEILRDSPTLEPWLAGFLEGVRPHPSDRERMRAAAQKSPANPIKCETLSPAKDISTVRR